MSRYIDADAVIARIAGQMSYEIEVETGNEIDCVDLAEELLNDIPSIDIEPKRGEWIEENGRVICSECRCNALRTMTGCLMDRHLDYNKSNFCPNCGADMRGKGDE